MSTLAKLFGKTSYLQVRLEFLRYPQVIKHVRALVQSSVSLPHLQLPMGGSRQSFRSATPSLDALFELGFPGSVSSTTSHHINNSLVHSTKGTLSPVTGSEDIVGSHGSFYLLPSGVLFTFPLTYWFTIGLRVFRVWR